MKNIAIIILLFISNILFSQEVCATPNNINVELEKMVNEKKMAYRGDISKKSFCVNIHFKIVRNSQGVGGINTNSLQRIIDELNLYYNPHNIYFNNIGFEYINDSRFVNMKYISEANTLLKMRNRDDAINYYIVDSFGIYNGMALQIPSHSLVVIKDRVFTSTSSHEVGHCLGLYHTFETHFCKEKIDGSNCSTCGDKVCDTPADEDDYNNNGYNPDLTNIMSYYPFRDHFTQGQFNRMKHYIFNTPLLQKVVATNCSYSNILEIQGNSVMCGGDTETYTVDNPNGDPITWQLSNNIEEVSRAGNSITIRAKSNAKGFATLTASNGINETAKKIWAGLPDVYVDYVGTVADIRTTGGDLSEQGIENNNIEWVDLRTNKVSTGASMHNISPYETEGYAIRVSNKCGVQPLSLAITKPCNPYAFVHWQGDNYGLTNPCERDDNRGDFPYSISTRTIAPKTTLSDNRSIITIQVANATGQVVLTTQSKTFSLANALPGTYYARVMKNGQVVHTQTLIKR